MAEKYARIALEAERKAEEKLRKKNISNSIIKAIEPIKIV